MADNTAVHYFASSVFGWNVADSIEDAKQTRLRLDRHSRTLSGYTAMIFEVPLPKDAHYGIRRYAPEVEGAKQVDEVYVE